MKLKSVLLLLILSIIPSLFCKAQKNLPKKKASTKTSFIPTGVSTEKLSPSTALFILANQEESINKDSLYQEYGVKRVNGHFYINAFISASSYSFDSLTFIEGSRLNGFRTGLVKIDELTLLSQLADLDYIQIGTKASLRLDEARKSIKVNEIHTGVSLDRAYKGEGVIVGIIDIGFDYTHPSFFDSSYTSYRVKRVWEQNKRIGSPPQGYFYGRELVGMNAILGVQADTASESHGTHVAGTAAGSGPNTNGLFTGVAPKSDIVLVSTDFTNSGLTDAVNYIFNYATQENKPCVINISIGGHQGPHDGTSNFDQAVDQLSGNGKIVVGAAGNEGFDSIHIRKTFSSTDTILYAFLKFPNSSLRTDGAGAIDIWGTPNNVFYTAINIFNTQNSTFEDWTSYIASNSNSTHTETLEDGDFLSDDLEVVIATSINPNNNKPNVIAAIDHTDQDDSYRWAMVEIIAYNGTIDLWFYAGDGIFTSNGYNTPVVNGQTTSTVGEIGGTGNSIISVGAFTSKNSYIDFNSNNRSVDYPVALGEIAPFSSHGPTADNRTKPDVTAPGNVIVAPVNSFDANYSQNGVFTVAGNSNGSKTWYYGVQQGTSMASPMVAGTIALWLERNPNLSPSDVKEILKEKSDQDSFTGSISVAGNNTWGWGKINAHEGMKKIVGLGEFTSKENSISIYPNPNNGEFWLSSDKLNNKIVRLYSSNGQLIREFLFSPEVNKIRLPRIKNGLYFLEVDGLKHKLLISQ